jgi:hypothetical protein
MQAHRPGVLLRRLARDHLSPATIGGSGAGGNDMGREDVSAQVGAEEARRAVVAAARPYFAERRTRVEPFVHRHFGLAGSVRLHRSALGLDVLRAPANIALAPVHVVIRLCAGAARLAGAAQVSRWLRARRVLLRTSVAAEVERLVATELLDLPWSAERGASGRDALAEAILFSPDVQALVAARTGLPAAALHKLLHDNVREYAGVRAAVAEITTSLAVLGAGAAALQKITPGMISLGPPVAAALVHSATISAFPLGAGAGSTQYWLFPAEASLAMAFGTTASLIAAGAIAAAFAGVLADPVQSRLGLHQRRLHRPVDPRTTWSSPEPTSETAVLGGHCAPDSRFANSSCGCPASACVRGGCSR